MSAIWAPDDQLFQHLEQPVYVEQRSICTASSSTLAISIVVSATQGNMGMVHLQVADGSPLLDAAAYGHVEVVNCLLDRKANLTTTWVRASSGLPCSQRSGVLSASPTLYGGGDLAAGSVMLTCSCKATGQLKSNHML